MQNEMRERLIDVLANSGCAADIQTFEELADHLIANGVILPLCDAGETVFFVLDCQDVPICECTVTEVGSRGFRTSAFEPAENDMNLFTPWEEIGKTVFFSYDDAENAVKERAKNEKP